MRSLATGATIPTLGFGTWQIPDGAPAYDATLRQVGLNRTFDLIRQLDE